MIRERQINEMMLLLGLDPQDQQRDYVARLMDAGEPMVSIRRNLRTEPPRAINGDDSRA